MKRVAFVKSFLPLLVLIFIGQVSCRKEKSQSPVIKISGPVTGSLYHVGDTIRVEALVEDDEGITGLSVSLINGNSVPVLPVKIPQTGSRSIVVSFDYPVDNPEIPTGDYSLMIFASDGESDSRAYVQVIIQELPRELHSVFVPVAGGAGQTSLFSLDSASAPLLIQNHQGDYLASAISTHQQRFYLSGKYTGALSAWNTGNNTVSWSVPNQAIGGSPFFTSLGVEKSTVLCGMHDGTIRGYSPEQVQGFFTQTDAGSYPVFLFPLPDVNRLFVLEEFIFGGARNLVTFNYPLGSVLSVWPTTIEIKGMFKKNNNEVYIAGNEAGTGKIYVYDLSQGMPFLRHQFTGNLILDAALADENHLLLATTLGIYEYDYNSSNPMPLVPGTVFQVLAFDDAGYELYAASGSLMQVYGYQLHQLVPLQQVAFPDSIRGIELLHNREAFN